MSSRSLGNKQVVPSEEFTSELHELLALARSEGARLRHARLQEVGEEERPRDPATSEVLSDRLRELLEDEFVPAYPVRGGLIEGEFEREIQKKALVGLRLETLKKVAREEQLDERGGSEDLAERIARAYKFDDGEIARLILENVDEPTAETSHESRIFPVEDPIDVDVSLNRLRLVENRLVRTGVARWLEVDALDADATGISISGSLNTYRAYVDERDDEPVLGSVPDPKRVKLRMKRDARVVFAEDANASVSRIAVRGVAAVIKNQLPDGLPIAHPLKGAAATFDPRTAVLLDLIYVRMPSIGVRDHNLTIARFMTEKADKLAQTAPEEAREHALKAVRFEGNHVLRSPQACQFIAKQQRGLVDVSLRVEVPSLGDEDGEPPWFPIRLTLEADHIGVMTGFGRYKPERSRQLHRLVIDQARAAVSDGPADLEALNRLAARIKEVAESGEPGAL